MRRARITALVLTATVVLLCLGYHLGYMLTDAVESTMEKRTARALEVMR